MQTFYKIIIAGPLAPGWSEWLGDLTITPIEPGNTMISGFISDQAGFYGVLNKFRDMNLQIIYLERDSSGEKGG
jgi:hypothetical protein